MLKKKTVYIVGIILFTLLLILDTAIYLAAPKAAGGFDGSQFAGMPQGGAAFPEGFDSFNMPSMGEGFDLSALSGMIQPSQENGFLASIRAAFIPILIVAIIGDTACAVMLVLIGRKNKSDESESTEQAHIDYNLPL